MEQNVIARLLNLSPPELSSLGEAGLLLAGLFAILTILAFALRRRQLGWWLSVVTAILLALSLIAVMDIFCLSGYLAPDGSCAWE